MSGFVRAFFKTLIRFYQLFLGPLMVGRCRFHPTCSVYAQQCLDHYPLGKAVVKTGYRLVRCQPFCKGGLDPA